MATHYSVSDWDLTSGWWLDAGTYVSSPSSIGIPGSGGATCKRSEVWNVPQGMIVTYARGQYDWGYTGSTFGVLFGYKNQATSGAGLGTYGLVTSGYTVVINANNNIVYYYRDASQTGSLALVAKPAHFDAWNKYRLTWWSDTGGGGLMIRLEYWDGTKWVKMVQDANYATDKYAGSTVNRVSIGSYYNYTVRFDDTEIWSV